MNRILFVLLILLSSYSSSESQIMDTDEWVVTCTKMEVDTIKYYEQYVFCLKNPMDGTVVKAYCKRYYMDNDFSYGSELKYNSGVSFGYIEDPFMLEIGDTLNLEK